MNICELMRLFKTIPDNAEINFVLQTKVSKEDLSKMKYPYPYSLDTLVYDGYDIGYSDNTLCILLSKE